MIEDRSLAPMFETQSTALFEYPGMADKGLGTLQNVTNFKKIVESEIIIRRFFFDLASLQHEVRIQNSK